MESPVQISFRNTPTSPALTSRIEALAEELTRLTDRITRCRVVVDAPHRHHRKGNPFQVRVELHLPGDEIVTHAEVGDAGDQENVYLAVRDAFEAAKRRVRDYTTRLNAHS